MQMVGIRAKPGAAFPYAVETYEGLKDDYLSLKAVLASLGVNLTDIDKIKE